MPKFTKSEFSKHCGISLAYLSMNIKRGKVRLTNGLIDDSGKDNQLFIEKCKSKPQKEPAPAKEGAKKASPTPIPLSSKRLKEPDEPSGLFNPHEPGGLEAKKTAQQIQKLEQEVAILKVKNEKAQGQVVQIDLVKALFSQHAKFTLVEYSNLSDRMLVRLAKQYSIPNAEVAKLKKEMIEDINASSKKATEQTRMDLANIVNEFSKKKENGEKN
jgi:hypothetical protein